MGFIFGGSSPKAPQMPPVPPAAHPPILGSTSAQQVAGTEAKAAEGMGSNGTIKTSPQGVSEAPTTAKATLLG